MTAEWDGSLITLIRPESDSKAASTCTQELLAARASSSFSMGNTTSPMSFRPFMGRGLRFVIGASYQAARHVAEGTLEIVLESYEIDPPPVSLVYPQSKRVPQQMSAFADFAMPRLRDRLALIAEQCSAP